MAETKTRNEVETAPASPAAEGANGAGEAAIFRSDAFESLVTNLNRAGFDKRQSYFASGPRLFDRETLDNLDETNGLGARINALPPSEMTRNGFETRFAEDVELSAEVAEEHKRLNTVATSNQALRWSRQFGGCGVIMAIDDGRALDQPVNEKEIRRVDGLIVFDRFQLVVRDRFDRLDRRRRNELARFGQPRIYELSVDSGLDVSSGRPIHADRVLRFIETELPLRRALERDGWGVPELERVYNDLINDNTSHDAAAALVQDFAQAVIEIEGLAEKLAADKEDEIHKRMMLLNYSRSVLRMLMLDKGETFKREPTPVTGLDALLKIFAARLSAVTGIPHTVLLGESPSGLGATGKAEDRVWHQQIEAMQTTLWQPQLERLTRLILLSREGPTKGVEPDGWFIDFNALDQLTEKEEAENRKLIAESDQIYIQNGVLSAREVRESRFAAAGFSADTVLIDETDESDFAKAGDADAAAEGEGATPPASEEDESDEDLRGATAPEDDKTHA